MLLLNSGLTTFDLIYKRFIIGKFFCQSAYHKSDNSWAHSAIASPLISDVCQSINRKSANFLGVPVRKSQSANLQGKNSVSDPDRHRFASNIFFT
jgi:hypothetical protein